MSWFWNIFWNIEEQVGESSMNDQTVVIDMDECLIHTFYNCTGTKYFNMIEKNTNTLPIRKYLFEVYTDKTIGRKNPSFGILRPGLAEFLVYCFSRFRRVILWSAGEDYYVQQVSEYFFNITNRMPDAVYARSKCFVTNDGMYTKPILHLSKDFPEISLESCFFIDDNPDNSFFNKENHILIPEFSPKCTPDDIEYALNNDRCLYDLIEWFESDEVKNAPDVRKLDKSKIFK